MLISDVEGWRLWGPRRRCGRDLDGEYRSAEVVVRRDDVSAVLLHDAVGNGQPESGAFSDVLGGKNGSKMCETTSGRTPSPVSRTDTTTRFPEGDTAVVISIRPGRPDATIACSAFVTILRNT